MGSCRKAFTHKSVNKKESWKEIEKEREKKRATKDTTGSLNTDKCKHSVNSNLIWR